MARPIMETLSYLLAQVGKAHRNHAALILGGCGVHVGQEMVLLHLWHEEGLTQTELVERLDVEPPTLTKALRRMERAGLLERRPDPDDARFSRVYLTAVGRSLEQPVRVAWDELEATTTADLTLEEQVLLRRLLLQVLRNLATSGPVTRC
jgi:DNA-binding MarR family transcriptional regulator